MRPATLVGAGLAVALAVTSADGSAADAPPDRITWPSRVGEVVLDHRAHSEVFAPGCVLCHHETHGATLSMPHPAYFEDFWIQCDQCHGEGAPGGEPRACSTCHHDSPATTSDETLGSRVVIHASCWRCHPVGRGQAASTACSKCHRQEERTDQEETP